VRVLIRAMASIVREVDARLVIAGSMIAPKFEQTLRDGIRELGLDRQGRAARSGRSRSASRAARDGDGLRGAGCRRHGARTRR
jgi:hypothetical protein